MDCERTCGVCNVDDDDKVRSKILVDASFFNFYDNKSNNFFILSLN